MNAVDWIAHSPCWMAAAVRGFANYGLSLSGMPGLVPVAIDRAVPARALVPQAVAAPRLPAGDGGASRR
jgi:hypothetical protein